MSAIQPPEQLPIHYPDSDGEPMSDNPIVTPPPPAVSADRDRLSRPGHCAKETEFTGHSGRGE